VLPSYTPINVSSGGRERGTSVRETKEYERVNTLLDVACRRESALGSVVILGFS